MIYAAPSAQIILAALITPLPQDPVHGPRPSLHVVVGYGPADEVIEVFDYDPGEQHFSAREFIGLTIAEAINLCLTSYLIDDDVKF